MQNEFQFSLVGVLTKADLGHPIFYNFSIEITFLPYKSTLLSLCGPPDLSAFLHSCMYMLNTNIAHIIPTSSQYCDYCLRVVWVAREYFSGVYCCLLYYSVLTQPLKFRPIMLQFLPIMLLSSAQNLPIMLNIMPMTTATMPQSIYNFIIFNN